MRWFLKEELWVWQDVPVLVIVSMLAYFCFLEQLLVTKMGTGAVAISLPFSCILGLLASMTSSTMVLRRFVWVYASMQFTLVVLFAHLFYSVLFVALMELHLHVQAVLSILLATFAGFGVAMSGNSILVEFLRRRKNKLARLGHQHWAWEAQAQMEIDFFSRNLSLNDEIGSVRQVWKNKPKVMISIKLKGTIE